MTMNKITKQTADILLNEFFLTDISKPIQKKGYLDFFTDRMKHHGLDVLDMGDVFTEWRADPDPIRNLISGNIYQVLVEEMGIKYRDTRDPELRKLMVGIALSLTIDSRQAFDKGETGGVECAQ